MDIDLDKERRDEDRIDLLRDADREKRGLSICPCCGKETKKLWHCAAPDCKERGCPSCMIFVNSEVGFVCGELCKEVIT